MSIPFTKYQATGNDFILIDNRRKEYSFSTDQIKKICDRRFGVGADGLILIEESAETDFMMIYYNSDGSQSLCGNGCRSAVNFASSLNLIENETSFVAYDGIHQATIDEKKIVRLQMSNVDVIKKMGSDYFLNTGSPHFIRFVSQLDKINVYQEGQKIRYSNDFQPDGTNVNFVELMDNNTIAVRTYERGVEDETLSCGTGVTAAALAASLNGYHSPVNVKVKGGELRVEFAPKQNNASLSGSSEESARFVDIFLIGPAKMVFEGQLDL